MLKTFRWNIYSNSRERLRDLNVFLLFVPNTLIFNIDGSMILTEPIAKTVKHSYESKQKSIRNSFAFTSYSNNFFIIL